MTAMELSTELPVAEAGRVIMALELAKINEQEAVLQTGVTVTAVHEMRKAIRRTFTSYRLFDPYFDRPLLKRYRRGLRKLMRRLGRSRDLAVFRMKLEVYNLGIDQPLNEFAAYWQEQQSVADWILTDYLSKPKPQQILSQYRLFTDTPGSGARRITDPWEPFHFGQLIPIMIFQRVARVRAFDDYLQSANLKDMHKLRIQFKELRYALDFFKPLLGPEIQPALDHLKEIQDHLGDLNDATVALELLTEVPGHEDAVSGYQAYQHQEIDRLLNSFRPVWETFNQPSWRQNLAMSIAVL